MRPHTIPLIGQIQLVKIYRPTIQVLTGQNRPQVAAAAPPPPPAREAPAEGAANRRPGSESKLESPPAAEAVTAAAGEAPPGLVPVPVGLCPSRALPAAGTGKKKGKVPPRTKKSGRHKP